MNQSFNILRVFFLKKLFFYYVSSLLILLFAYCGDEKKQKPNIENIKVPPVKIYRYEKVLFDNKNKPFSSYIASIANDYSFFIGDNYKDTNRVNQLKEFVEDPLMKQAYADVMKQYPSVEKLEKDLHLAFTYLTYYFPDFQVPKVYTYISGYDYEFPIKYGDSVLVIALDMYLGEQHKAYPALQLPLYRINKMKEQYILPNCVQEIVVQKYLPYYQPVTLLDNMIYEGKKLYLIDLALPDVADSIKFAYSPAQMKWCVENEANVWSYLIERKALYAKDKLLINRFVGDAPFTAVFSKTSAPRVVNWIGYNIVVSYMNNNKAVNIEEMLNDNDAANFLKKSKYKPRK